MAGIPKFCLPISESRTLLHWHVDHLLEVCDEVRVCTRSIWAPFVEELELPVTLYVKAPSTMSDALRYMARSDDDFLVGMPDTIVADSTGNFYRDLAAQAAADPAADVILAAFDCPPAMRGQVGQIDVDASGAVRDVIDKDPACGYPRLWGGMLLRRGVIRSLDPRSPTPSAELRRWVAERRVRAAICDGRYIDMGRPSALGDLPARG